MVARLKSFLAVEGAHFGRELAGAQPDWGHVTGSSWIVDESGENVVLVFHGKLQQMGATRRTLRRRKRRFKTSPMREAREETGLERLGAR